MSQMAAYNLAYRMARRTRNNTLRMKMRLATRTGIQYGSFSHLSDDGIAHFFASFANGDMGVDQIARSIAVGKYCSDDNWKWRYQSVRAALYRLMAQNQDEAHYAQIDIQAFNAPSECFGLVMHQQEERTHAAVWKIFKQAKMDPRLFWALNNAHGHTHARRADDIDSPEWWLEMEFKYHTDDPYFRKHYAA